MSSKQRRIEKKRANIKARKDHIASKNDSNNSNRSKTRKKALERINNDENKAKERLNKIERTFNETIANASAIIKKVQSKYDINDDDNVAGKLIYNSIITKIGQVVNQFKPITRIYNTINEDINLENLKSSINVDAFDFSLYNFEEQITDNDLKSINDNHNTDLTTDIDNWSLGELQLLDMFIVNGMHEYYGLGQNSQFEKNYIQAGELIGLDSKPLDDLNKIVEEEIERGNNDAARTYDLIWYRFEDMKAERFDNSDKIKRQRALNKHTKTTNRSPQERKRIRNK